MFYRCEFESLNIEEQVLASLANCSLLDSVSEDFSIFSEIGITSVDILYVYTWGFGVVFLSFSIGYSIGIALKMIKLL